jgi:repressor of nif and glnA expression
LFEPTAEKDPIKSGKASARIIRKLRLLREHGLIRKVSKTQYYRVTEKGHQVMTTSIAFRETDIAPLKAAKILAKKQEVMA